jgi:hypothetical protein
MRNGKTEVAMKALHLGVGLVIVVESVIFAFNYKKLAEAAHIGLPAGFLLALAVCEIIAALLFLFPRTMLSGGWALLVVLSIAALIHILHGQFNVGTLVIYGFAVVAVMAHYSDERNE